MSTYLTYLLYMYNVFIVQRIYCTKMYNVFVVQRVQNKLLQRIYIHRWYCHSCGHKFVYEEADMARDQYPPARPSD